MRRVRFRKVALRLAAATALALGGFVAWRYAGGNFGTVEAGRVYRSGQLGPDSLGRTLRDYRIKAVLNLRGCNPDREWYRAERAATRDAGAIHIDVPMATDQYLSRGEARALVEILDDAANYPMLVPCEWGAERTGLVSAFAELLRPGGSLGSARGQFSARYLYLPTRDGRIMAGHLDLYAAWLAGRGLAHTPERFREWLSECYRPPAGRSRESWPYNPYPLMVVVGPDGSRRERWDPRTPAGGRMETESPRDRPEAPP